MTRRDVIRVLAVAAASGVAWRLGADAHQASIVRTRILMGTELRLRVLGDDTEAAAAAADAAFDRMAALDRTLSRFLPESDVGRLNRTGHLEGASPDLLHVLAQARELFALGDGAFDATVQPLLELYRSRRLYERRLPDPAEIERARAVVDQSALRVEGDALRFDRAEMRLTLDGIAKGYVVEQGVEALRSRGFANAYVEAGGDLIARGRKRDGAAWVLGIQHPRGRGLHARFELRGDGALSVAASPSSRHAVRGCAVATSGDYMQPFTRDHAHHHILDPRTGFSAPDLASATVVTTDAARADGLATLVMVLGAHEGRELLESLPDCEGYLITKDLDVVQTSGFRVV